MVNELPPPPFDDKGSPFGGPHPLTVTYTNRQLRMCFVEESELENIATIGGLNFGFLGVCLGALISFGIVLTTATIDSPKVFAAYVALAAVSLLGSVFFGFRTGMDLRAKKKKLNQLRGNLPD